MVRISGEQYEVDKLIEDNLHCLAIEGCLDPHSSYCAECLIKMYGLDVTYDSNTNK